MGLIVCPRLPTLERPAAKAGSDWHLETWSGEGRAHHPRTDMGAHCAYTAGQCRWYLTLAPCSAAGTGDLPGRGPTRPAPNNNLGHWVSEELPAQAASRGGSNNAPRERLSASRGAPSGKDSCRCIWFPQTSSHVPFPFVGSAFPVITHA